MALRPTAAQTEFQAVPGMVEAWESLLNAYFEFNIFGVPTDTTLSAVEELRRWGRSESDLRFYNPLSMPVPSGSTPVNVHWKALPTSFDAQFGEDRDALLRFLDERGPFPDEPSIVTRLQDEYCEWVVERNAQDEIVKVTFTSEPPEYFQFLAHPPEGVNVAKARALLVELYRGRTGEHEIELADLFTGFGTADESYDWYNRFNNRYAVHMQQPNNTLGAQVNIAARAAILRQRGGAILTDALQLIRCGLYGGEERQSDPAIGAGVNSVARENRFLTFEDPVGLYMTGLNTTGWTTPDGTDAQSFWTVKGGIADPDANKAMIVRAEFAVPPGKGYTVSQVKIGGEAIRFGGEIAARIDVRVAVMQSPVLTIPPPRAIGCRNQVPTPLSGLTFGGAISPQMIPHSRRG